MANKSDLDLSRLSRSAGAARYLSGVNSIAGVSALIQGQPALRAAIYAALMVPSVFQVYVKNAADLHIALNIFPEHAREIRSAFVPPVPHNTPQNSPRGR